MSIVKFEREHFQTQETKCGRLFVRNGREKWEKSMIKFGSIWGCFIFYVGCLHLWGRVDHEVN